MVLLLILLGLIFLLGVNYYLSQEKLFFYSTGTDIIAVENATWLMSEKEVTRANHAKFLRDTIIDYDKPKHIKERTKDVVVFNGYQFKLRYVFYKDQLVKCSLFIWENGGKRDIWKDSVMVIYLRKRYNGKFYGGIDSSRTFCMIDSKDVIVYYSSYLQPVLAMTLKEGCKQVEFVSQSVILAYKPFNDTLDIVYKHLQ